MGDIEYVSAEDRQFVSMYERAETDPEMRAALETMPGDQAKYAVFVHHEGDDETPQLLAIRFGPGDRIEPHAHRLDEIMVVLDGEARFGRRRFTRGSSVFIPAMTLYAFTAGPEGATILNFRPARETGAIWRDQLPRRSGLPIIG
jgi:quercetin dioxygenase-like cupin family protein